MSITVLVFPRNHIHQGIGKKIFLWKGKKRWRTSHQITRIFFQLVKRHHCFFLSFSNFFIKRILHVFLRLVDQCICFRFAGFNYETLEASKYCTLARCCYSSSKPVHSYRISIKVILSSLWPLNYAFCPTLAVKLYFVFNWSWNFQNLTLVALLAPGLKATNVVVTKLGLLLKCTSGDGNWMLTFNYECLEMNYWFPRPRYTLATNLIL